MNGARVHDVQEKAPERLLSGASTPRANPEGSQAQDAIGKTEMAVVVPTKSPAPGEAGLRGPN